MSEELKKKGAYFLLLCLLGAQAVGIAVAHDASECPPCECACAEEPPEASPGDQSAAVKNALDLIQQAEQAKTSGE